MATKSDFTAQEWETLRDAPQLVMLSVATAGSSGPFGSLKEAFAPAGAIIEAAKGGNELLRSICDREELKAAQKSLRSSIKIGSDIKALRNQLQIGGSGQSGCSQLHIEAKGIPAGLGRLPPTAGGYCRPNRKGGEGRRLPGIWRRMGQRRRTRGDQPDFAGAGGFAGMNRPWNCLTADEFFRRFAYFAQFRAGSYRRGTVAIGRFARPFERGPRPRIRNVKFLRPAVAENIAENHVMVAIEEEVETQEK